MDGKIKGDRGAHRKMSDQRSQENIRAWATDGKIKGERRRLGGKIFHGHE
jgi:hypothetical protein